MVAIRPPSSKEVTETILKRVASELNPEKASAEALQMTRPLAKEVRTETFSGAYTCVSELYHLRNVHKCALRLSQMFAKQVFILLKCLSKIKKNNNKQTIATNKKKLLTH